MAVIASAQNTVFTPAVGPFVIQVSGGNADLLRRVSATAAWVNVAANFTSINVDNPIAGVQFMVTSNRPLAVVEADQ